jgi:hypothetical protein
MDGPGNHFKDRRGNYPISPLLLSRPCDACLNLLLRRPVVIGSRDRLFMQLGD